jgi:hypothetical protein
MRRRTNLWHDAICDHLRQAGGPLTVEQIWERMAAAAFRHSSKMPRSTLGARIAELVQMKCLERVGPAMYQLTPGTMSTQARPAQQPSSEVSP